MKLFDVVLMDSKDSGVIGISLVNDPAMEANFIALNKSGNKNKLPVKFSSIDKEQRIVLGVVLIPNKPIYREGNDGEGFYINFSADVIKESAHKFLKLQNNNNSTIEHDNNSIKGVSVVESWIVEDTRNDKSNAFNLNASLGSWVVKMKIDNDEIWNDFIKTGSVKGFSIDGIFDLKSTNINLNKSSKMKKTVFTAMLARMKGKPLGAKKGTSTNLSRHTSDDGTLTFESDTDVIEVGTTLMIVLLNEDNTEVSEVAPDAIYTIEGKNVETIGGVVVEITEANKSDDDSAEIAEELALAKVTIANQQKVITALKKKPLEKFNHATHLNKNKGAGGSQETEDDRLLSGF